MMGCGIGVAGGIVGGVVVPGGTLSIPAAGVACVPAGAAGSKVGGVIGAFVGFFMGGKGNSHADDFDWLPTTTYTPWMYH